MPLLLLYRIINMQVSHKLFYLRIKRTMGDKKGQIFIRILEIVTICMYAVG